MRETCISVSSFADTEEKQKILKECILSLKKLHLPILLLSHCEVPSDIQSIVDYFFYDKNNLLIKDSEIFNELTIEDVIDTKPMTTEFIYANSRFASGVFKKNYFSACFTNVFNSYNLLKMLGFKYVIQWEYDYLLGDESSENILKLLYELKNSGKKASFFNFNIHRYTSVHPNPSIFEIEYILNRFLSKEYVGDVKSYLKFSKNTYVESWKYYIISDDEINHISRPISDLNSFIPDTKRDLFKVEHDDFKSNIYYSNMSGFYFKNENDIITNKLIYGIINPSKSPTNIDFKLYFNDKIILNKNITLNHWWWNIFPIDEKYIDSILKKNGELKLIETITCNDNSEEFVYYLNKQNIEVYKKFKQYKSV